MHAYQKILCKKLQFLEDHLLDRCMFCFQNKHIFKLVYVRHVNVDCTESTILIRGRIIFTWQIVELLMPYYVLCFIFLCDSVLNDENIGIYKKEGVRVRGLGGKYRKGKHRKTKKSRKKRK